MRSIHSVSNCLDADPLAVDLKEDLNSINILRKFMVGINQIELEWELVTQGPIDTDLEPKLTKYLADPPIDETDKKELLFETDHVTYYIFKDNNVFYLFTSQPCDHEGCFFGREEWEVPPKPIEEIEDEEIQEELTDLSEEGTEAEESYKDEQTDQEVVVDDFYYDTFNLDDLDLEEEVDLKHSSHFWREISARDGRAFIAWFTQPEYLVQHILINIPDTMKKEKFSLNRIVIKSVAQVKEYFNPKLTERTDPYDGDYYCFKEIERSRWILRGTYDETYEMFPEMNRGRQTIANCFTALGFLHLYDLMTFNTETVNTILKFGDRLLTFTKNLRRKGLRESKEVRLTESQIEEIMTGETFGVNDIFRTYSVGEQQVMIEVHEFELTGEIKADEEAEILNVNKALVQFFAENKFGILCSKDLCVAIFKGGNKMFYMFDSQSRGPSGIKCTNGVACITRFMELEPMANLFLKNLGKEGKNAFVIHKVSFYS